MSRVSRPLRGLVRTFLLMDLRAQHYSQATGVGAGALIPPLYWVIGQFLTLSALTTAALFGRVDAEFFAAANLGVLALGVFSAMVVEFHEAALDPADASVLAWRPIPRRTYALARMTNVGVYVGGMILLQTIFPAIVGAAQRDVGMGWLPLYALAALAVGGTAAALVVLLHALRPLSRALDDLRTGFAWVQIVGIMVVFYGGQLMLRNGTGSLEWFAAHPPAWFSLMPTTPLGGAIASASRGGPGLGLVAAALGVGVLTVGVATAQLGRAWADLGRLGSDTARTVGGRLAGTLGSGWIGALTGSRGQAAGLWLFRTALLRDSELRSRSLPALGTGAAAAALGVLTDQFADPFVAGASADVVLPLAAIVLLAAASPSLLYNTLFSRDHAAAWRLRAAPSPAELAEGVRKGVALLVLLPATLAVGIAAQVAWRAPLHAAGFALGTWLVVSLCSKVAAANVFTDVPLSRPAARGGALGPIAVLTAGIGAVASTIVGLLWLARGTPALLGAAVGALVIADVIAGRMARHRMARILGRRS